ncbi:spore protease YyaC [Paenibacillus sp. F411]|uniref:Sporulation protein YyaC n=1 Tax=Paenibacillus algicola TaxID=2565926 RepID=A0A4P8XSC6_9BACL|nr:MULTISPECIES: spore protease YyaC [Paenibacillus]MBO2944483.1 spore protease YyaC [Paenibacillus sp. F411]QCT04900.1 sporulation protein YyaC [Paenibacillus algicola]
MKRPVNSPSLPTTPSLKLSHSDPEIHPALIHRLLYHLSAGVGCRPLVVVCIGTDRSTGDCLGPLVGTALARYHSSMFHLYGTLDDPVHAMNLQDTLSMIYSTYDNPYIIGVDACLGQTASVGSIQISDGPLKPGAGVNKELPPVGDIHITGIVNVGGFMEYFVLQNTRLSLVMRLSDIIASCLFCAMKDWHRSNLLAAQDG